MLRCDSHIMLHFISGSFVRKWFTYTFKYTIYLNVKVKVPKSRIFVHYEFYGYTTNTETELSNKASYLRIK